MPYIMLTETWLRDHLDAELQIPNYSLYRADRNRAKKRRGRNSGGVAIYLRNDIAAHAEVLLQYSNGVNEALCIKLEPQHLILCTLYRQPDDPVGGNRSTSNEFRELLGDLTEVLENLPSPSPNILIGGDFNLPKVSWPSCSPLTGSSSDDKKMTHMLAEFCSQHFLVQLTNQPTHNGGNVLDLLLTNNEISFSFDSASPTSPVSSHFLVVGTEISPSAEQTHAPGAPTSVFDQLNFFDENTKWVEMSRELENINWALLFEDKSVENSLELFIKTCEEVAIRFTPPKVSQQRAQGSRPKIPRDRRILMRKRIRLRKQYNNTINVSRKASIRMRLAEIERKLQDSYKSQEMFTEAKAVEAIKANPKYFYKYAKKKSKTVSPVGPLKDHNGCIKSNPLEMANILSDQFKSAFSIPSQQAPDQGSRIPELLSDIDFTMESILSAIDEVSYNSAPGPDRFPAILLKNCKNALCKPLYFIWRKSLDTGEIPLLLKTSSIIPIFKDGDRKVAKNYRPVALTSHLIKVFEKVVRNVLVIHLESNNLMNPNQHGFRAGHSCLSQLLHHHDCMTKLLEEGKNVDVIYLDFAKAFDKLDFAITLNKLSSMGVAGKIYRWIKSFLTAREQYVYVDGHKSEVELVLSGVPQGSVIGPLLFLVLLNDIDNNINFSRVSSFADDTRVMAGICSSRDASLLQADLDLIYQWAESNNAVFNSSKFELLRYGRNEEIKTTTSYTSNHGNIIQNKNNNNYVRDLGITLSDDATFSHHIANITLSASLKCGWILRTFKNREEGLMMTLWKSLVLPILDYCSQLWSPSTEGQIQKIEKVQVCYVRKIIGLSNLDYWQQLARLGLYSLQRRRERYRIIYIWKVLEEMVPNFGIVPKYNKRTGRYCMVPAIRSSATCRTQTIRFSSMGVNGPIAFNHLPVRLRNMSNCSVDAFKCALDKYLKTVPDQPRVPGLVRYCLKGGNSITDY